VSFPSEYMTDLEEVALKTYSSSTPPHWLFIYVY